MHTMHVKSSFKFETELDAEFVYDNLTEIAFDLGEESSNLFDGITFGALTPKEIHIAFTGVGETADDAVGACVSGIRKTIQRSGGAAPDWGVPDESGNANAIYTFVSEEITVAELHNWVKLPTLA